MVTLMVHLCMSTLFLQLSLRRNLRRRRVGENPADEDQRAHPNRPHQLGAARKERRRSQKQRLCREVRSTRGFTQQIFEILSLNKLFVGFSARWTLIIVLQNSGTAGHTAAEKSTQKD